LRKSDAAQLFLFLLFFHFRVILFPVFSESFALAILNAMQTQKRHKEFITDFSELQPQINELLDIAEKIHANKRYNAAFLHHTASPY
jgi:hypothetical protein